MSLENNKKLSKIFIFLLLALLITAIFSPFGIDLTDEGKQMSISWFMFRGDTDHSYSQNKIGSWLINGLWLSIIGKPLLIWERVGGVLLMSIMALFAYLLIKKYKDDNYTIFIAFTTLLFVICRNHPETKIDHSNLPTLLAIISLYFLFLFIKEDYEFNGNVILIICSALIMLVSIFTRSPHVLFLLFPAIFFIMSKYIYNIENRKIINAYIFYYGPLIIIVVLGLLFSNKTLFLKNISSRLLSIIFSVKDINKIILNNEELRDISYDIFLLKRYIKDLIYIIILSVLFIISFRIGGKLFKVFDRSKYYSKKFEVILFVILAIFLFVFMLIKPWMWYMVTFGFILAYLMTIFYRRVDLKKEFFYLFWGVLLVIISFLGSNNSFRHSVPAGAVFVLVPIIALMNKDKKESLEKLNLYFLYKFTIIFFIILLFVSGYKKIFDDNKRDVQPIFARNTMFKSPELFGVFSSKNRVEVIDGIILESKKIIKRDNTLICFNSVPMLHYLLNRDYFLDDPWVEQLSIGKLKNRLETKALKNIFPDYIIFAKKSARENNWPDTDVLYEPADKKKYEYMIDYIDKNNYKNIYENYGFILYKK